MVKLDGAAGEVTISSDTKITLDSEDIEVSCTNATVTALNTTWTGSMTYLGMITLPPGSDIIFGTTTLKTHVHTSALPGSPTSTPIGGSP